MSHRFTLEGYRQRGTTRFDCPRCNAQKSFARYVDTETGKHLGESVGKCNRESNCQYHYTPKQFFSEQPEIKEQMFPREPIKGDAKKNRQFRRAPKFVAPVVTAPKTFSVIKADVVKLSLRHYQDNGLARYLFSIIEAEAVEAALKRYFVGTWTNKDTVFWQIDGERRVRTGKLIDYDPYTGKRRKSAFSAPNWVHSELKRESEAGKPLSFATVKAQELYGNLDEDFTANICFFGEHLLGENFDKPAAIVESEKTAVIASIFQSDFVWLAIGGKSYLKPERLRKLIGRRIVLFPDADGFVEWSEAALNARRTGLDVEVSDIIERHATTEEKQKGFDIADYILSARIAERENSNEIIDLMLNDADLLIDFEERMAIIAIDRNLSQEVEESPEFVRAVAAYVYYENEARKALLTNTSTRTILQNSKLTTL